MELLHVGVNVAEHCELLRGNLVRREDSSTNSSDTPNTTDTTNATSDHSTHTATRRGHLLQHRTRHLHGTGMSWYMVVDKDTWWSNIRNGDNPLI